MRDRQPFCLRKTIQFYNISLVVINAFYFFHELIASNFGKELLNLEIPSDDEVSPSITYQMNLYYFYVLTKIIDLSDTFFSALRKKRNQITFLHLYHHSLMVLLSWVAFWFRFNIKPNSLFILVNSLVHTIMYSYYTLAAFGPKVQKYLWWKKYLTQLQLAQFIIFIIYGIINEIMGIPYPNLLKYGTQAQSPFFFYLFYDFYKSSYKRKQRLIEINNNNNNIDEYEVKKDT